MSTASAPRIVVSAVEPALADRMASALAGVGAVERATRWEACANTAAIALWVIHVGALDAPLPAGRPIVVVAPGAGLAEITRRMIATPEVVAVVAVDDLSARSLGALAARVVSGVPAGIAALVGAGAGGAARVGEHGEQRRCLAAVIEAAARVGALPARRAALEQVLDELIANALYDAPADAAGRRLFAEDSPRARRGLRTDREVEVTWGCDGERFVVAVRDTFGTLTRAAVLEHLDKGLHAARPVEDKIGGAGLGLYLVVHAASEVWFHVVPGGATEVVCALALASPIGLTTLAVIHSEPAGWPPIAPARRISLRARARRRWAGALAGVAAVALAVLAWARRPPPPPAVIELESEPSGAAVTLDGVAIGATPLTVTTAPPGAQIAVELALPGYRPATVQLTVPPAGERTRLVQPLTIAADVVRVRFVSRPPGATIVEDGRPPTTDRTYTPAELLVTAGQEHRFTLTMPRHVPLVIPPFTPARGSPPLEKGGELPEAATLRVEATLSGEIAIAEAPHCPSAPAPRDCLLAPGSYTATYRGPDGELAHSVTMGREDATLVLQLGVIEAAPGQRLEPGGRGRLVVEAGAHTVTVVDANGRRRVGVTVGPGATVSVR